MATSMSGSDFRDYILRLGLIRTDKDTEVYEAISDATQILRREFGWDEAKTEITTTDTIVSLGDFKVSVESDLGIIRGVVLEDGTNTSPLVQKTKLEFDQIYPDINVTANRGYPRHFTVYGGNIYFGPIPDQTSYVYRVTYTKDGETITSGTASVPFTDYYRDLLADLTLHRVYFGLGETQLSSDHFSRYLLELENAKRREKQNSGGTGFNMHPSSV